MKGLLVHYRLFKLLRFTAVVLSQSVTSISCFCSKDGEGLVQTVLIPNIDLLLTRSKFLLAIAETVFSKTHSYQTRLIYRIGMLSQAARHHGEVCRYRRSFHWCWKLSNISRDNCGACSWRRGSSCVGWESPFGDTVTGGRGWVAEALPTFR